jgi:tetratricopeptide (TPR) repeat protein
MVTEGAADTAPAAQVYYGWGLTLSSLGRPLEAEKLIHRTIVMDSGDENARDALPWELNSHAKVLRDLGRLDEAASQAERGYAGSLKNGDAARINQALLLRASIYRLRGDLAKAQEMLDEAEQRGHRLLPGNIFFASLLSEKAQLALARGDTGTALDLMNQAVPIAEASVKAGQLGADLLPVLLIYRSDMERQLGRVDEAIATANQALGRIEEAAQPGTFSVLAGHAHLALGRALQTKGKGDDAIADFRRAAEHLEKSLGADNAEAHTALQMVASKAP